MKNWIRNFLSLSACFVLVACTQQRFVGTLRGNAEGFEGRKPVPEGRAFYRIDPSYRCQLPSGETVSSYSDSFVLTPDNRVVTTGDLCSTEVRDIGGAESLQFDTSKNAVALQGKIYDLAPDLTAYSEAFCRIPVTPGDESFGALLALGLGLRILANPSTQSRVMSFVGMPSAYNNIKTEETVVTYDVARFQVSERSLSYDVVNEDAYNFTIDLTSTAVTNAALTRLNEPSYPQPFHCIVDLR